MKRQIHLGIVSLTLSTALLCSSATETNNTDTSSSNHATTAAAITSNVTTIVSTATGLIANHSPSAIISSVGQLVNSLLSIVSSLVHKHDEYTNNDDLEIDYSSVTSEVYESDSDESTESLTSSDELDSQDQDDEDASYDEADSADEAFDDADAVEAYVNSDEDGSVFVTINVSEPITITLDLDQMSQLIVAIEQARKELEKASLKDLVHELQKAEAAAHAEMVKNQARGDQLEEHEAAVTLIVQTLIHDLFALVQEGDADAQLLAEEITSMLSSIIEQAVDTIKYEQLSIDDVEACAARCINRVCAELTRQIHHLLVQSALTLRGSTCSVACCKRPAHLCAAAIAMITGRHENMTVRSCKACCRPSCNNCNCTSSSNSCNTCNSGKCCCNRMSSMEETRKGCGCNNQCPTCKSTNCQDESQRCPCQHNKPTAKQIVLKCPCMNKPKPATATDAQPRFKPSYKENGCYVPEVYRS